MSLYNIYYNGSFKEQQKLKICTDQINIYGFIFGPIIFLFYGMWKEFFLYILFLFTNAFLVSSNITTIEFYWLFYVVIFCYLGVDFYNRYEQHLLSKGYILADRIIAVSKLDAEIRYLHR